MHTISVMLIKCIVPGNDTERHFYAITNKILMIILVSLSDIPLSSELLDNFLVNNFYFTFIHQSLNTIAYMYVVSYMICFYCLSLVLLEWKNTCIYIFASTSMSIS